MAEERDVILPPQAIGAEKATLGCCLIDTSAFGRIADMLRPEDFYRQAHQNIFAAMRAINQRGDGIDYITVSQELTRRGCLEECGGSDYVVELAEIVPYAGQVVSYGRIVAEKATRRRVIVEAAQLMAKAYDDGEDLTSSIAASTSSLLSLQLQDSSSQVLSAAELMDEWWAKADEGPSRLRTSNRTYIAALDQMIGGYVDSDLQYWGGGPGSGKTTLAMQTSYLSARHGEPELYVSMELGKHRFIERLIGFETSVPSKVLQYGPREIYEQRMPEIVRGVGVIHGLPLFVTFGSKSTQQIVAHAKDLQSKLGRKLRCLKIDRLEMLADRDCRSLDEVKRIPILSPRVKAIATELDIPVVCLAQLNRKGQEGPPSMADFRGSGAIEQDCQVGIIIRSDRKNGTAQFHVVKQNDGDLGPCPSVLWQYRIPRFCDIDRVHTNSNGNGRAAQVSPVQQPTLFGGN